MSTNTELKIGNKNIHIRKWKVKDKNKYKDAIKNNNFNAIKEALVYDCIDEDIALTNEEYKFVLVNIRKNTFGDDLSLEFPCEKCGVNFIKNIKISEVFQPIFSSEKMIITKNNAIEIGDFFDHVEMNDSIGNAKNLEEANVIEFAYKMKFINGNLLPIEEKIDFINELDADEAEEIFKKWEEIQFKNNIIHKVKCENCGNEEEYEFDDLPGFFPDSWLN